MAKAAVTVAAAGAAAYAGYLGTQIENDGDETTVGVTEPSSAAPKQLASAQRQLTIIQWIISARTGTAVVLAAYQGEQQRGPLTWLDTIRG